ncbi:hypothetical protein LEP1GSC047_4112 [Leptospira inadai serovar Lyme str. 10]|uniref:Uncharacterized protein n=1 Tax=Leptospira inadai serovar Lyme str. 10 TaxID=1049790 RepID=V6HM28_9LEPT|nr:hypothetical protein LEP1GSC047_4112 [Leptospira inadai serovar Lyme str. 10]
MYWLSFVCIYLQTFRVPEKGEIFFPLGFKRLLLIATYSRQNARGI